MTDLELEDMPMDIIRMIIAPLQLRDRLRLRNVSRRFREVVDAAPFTFNFIHIDRDENRIIVNYPGFGLAYTGLRHCSIWIGNGRRVRRHRRSATKVALEYLCRLLSHKSISINFLSIHVRGANSERFLVDLLICLQTIEWHRGGPIDVRNVSMIARTFSLPRKDIFESFRINKLDGVELSITDRVPAISLEDIRVWRQIRQFRFFGGGLTGLANSSILSRLAYIFVCAVISSQDAMEILNCHIQNPNFRKMEMIVDFRSTFRLAEFARFLGIQTALPFPFRHRVQIPNSQEDIFITCGGTLVYEKIARHQ
uniref:F-box domain-containing protein n=1 Tax=Caenorhabditis tropicalis TaxID=1561998 RepID=A0A1I7T364_9PELO